MENMETFRREEARRLLRWIRDDGGKWEQVKSALSPGIALITVEYQELLKTLKKHSFYQLIIAVLYSDMFEISDALERTLLGDMADEWDDKRMDNFLDAVIDNVPVN